MGRPSCHDKPVVKRSPWTAEEDMKLLAFTSIHGTKNWPSVPEKAGLERCGKSCRLRWINYLRPNLKHEGFTPQEEERIISLHATIGSRWSIIAQQLPGRTDNDIKNLWNTKLRKKLVKMGIDPITHRPISEIINHIDNLSNAATSFAQYSPHPADTQISRLNLLQQLKQTCNPSHCTFREPLHTHFLLQAEESSSSSTQPMSPELDWKDFLVDDSFQLPHGQVGDDGTRTSMVEVGQHKFNELSGDHYGTIGEEVSDTVGAPTTTGSGSPSLVDETLELDKDLPMMPITLDEQNIFLGPDSRQMFSPK